MARTKGNHANFRTPSPSPSPPRSPSPPSPPSSPTNHPPISPESSEQTPPQTITHTSPLNKPKIQNPKTIEEPSSKTSPTKLSLPEKVDPLNFILPPLFQATAPNLNQTPPHLKTKKANSAPSLRRRSSRLLSARGTKKTGEIDNTIHEISDSDGENAYSSHQPNPNSSLQKTAPLPENPETTNQPTNRENKSLQNQDDFVEVEPIAASDKLPSQIETPKEIPKSPSKQEEKEEVPAAQERSLGSSRTRNKGKRKLTVDSEPSPIKQSVSKRGKTHNLSVSRSKFIPLIDPDLTKNFFDKWSSRPVGVGRYFDFQKLEDAEIFVRQYPDALGWVPFLQIREKYYPEAVQAFYCMAECYPEKNVIISHIKGVKVEISLETISKLLNIPLGGPAVFGDDWYDILHLDRNAVFDTIYKPNATDLSCSNLLHIPQILANMCHNSFLPKSGTFNHISHNDILLIYHMFTGKQINLPFIILKNMMMAVNSTIKTGTVPYGMALSKIFRLLEIPLHDEISSFKISTFGPKNVHQMKTKPDSFITPVIDQSQSHGLKRKSPISIEHLLNCLQNETTTHRECSPVSQEHAKLLDNFAKNPILPKFQNMNEMKSFFEEAAPANKLSVAAPIFVSPPRQNYSALFRSESIDKFFADPPFYDSSVPLQSASPSFNVLTGASLPPSMNEHPPKRSKTEKNIRRIRKDILKMFESLHGIMNHIVYDSMERTLLRQWYTSLAAKWGVDAPMANPFPPPPAIPMPVPSASSSSDASSPSS
ncbi:hypothetical protein MTR_2g009130 [Medicago truncatula]|uniref:Putative plant transposon protein domain-containing protein n=1 Tax=Medicago truncatula TaxID=3880 RepID=G7IPK3_MEDTR|nr:hypothetical protein MTR_2g009130 [Medicago truncatula]